MQCASPDCAAMFFPGQAVVEVSGQYFCPKHVREVTISRDGTIPVRPEPILLRRPRYEPLDQPEHPIPV